MNVGQICNRQVVFCRRGTPVVEVLELVAEELDDFVGIVGRERVRERRLRH